MSDLPSVTRILRAQGYYAPIPIGASGAVRQAMDRGTLVHQLCADGCDPSAAPEHVRGYMEAFVRARLELQIEPIWWEQLVEAPKLGYCGKPDLLAWQAGQRTVIDLKTGDAARDPTTVLQLAAYGSLLNSDAYQIGQCAALALLSTGAYRWYIYTLTELRAASEPWCAAVCTYRWRADHGRLPSRGPREKRPPWEGEPAPWENMEVDDA